MINVKELRCGNYIEAVWEQEMDRGNGIIEDVEQSEIVEFQGYNPFEEYIWAEDGDGDIDRYVEVNPIPITEEWLEKFAFKKVTSFVFGKSTGVGNILIEDTPSYHWVGWSQYPIKYVHQLQNLYYALTGEELTIKK